MFSSSNSSAAMSTIPRLCHCINRISLSPRNSISLSIHTRSLSTSLPILTPRPRVLVLAGPTSSGKSAAAIRIAERLNGEIISCDSVQVYRGLNIGSGKIPILARRSIPHFGFDLVDLHEKFSSADWSEFAREKIHEISSRGKVPIIVGGSMFYLHWLLYGPLNVERVEPKFRASISEKMIGTSEESANKFIESLNLNSVSLDYFNKMRSAGATRKRLARAIEIILMHNGPPPPLKSPEFDFSSSNSSFTSPFAFDFRCFHYLFHRVWLFRHVDYRCETMFADGIVEETIRAIRQSGFSAASPQATAIGYRQVLDYISSSLEIGDFSPAPLLECLARVQNATRPYVRQQMLWFRKEPIYQFVRVETPAVPIDAKSTLPIDSYSLAIDEAVKVEDRIVEQFQMPELNYWSELLLNPIGIENQRLLRAEATDVEMTKNLKRYQPKLHLLNNPLVVKQILQNIRAEWENKQNHGQFNPVYDTDTGIDPVEIGEESAIAGIKSNKVCV